MLEKSYPGEVVLGRTHNYAVGKTYLACRYIFSISIKLEINSFHEYYYYISDMGAPKDITFMMMHDFFSN